MSLPQYGQLIVFDTVITYPFSNHVAGKPLLPPLLGAGTGPGRPRHAFVAAYNGTLARLGPESAPPAAEEQAKGLTDRGACTLALLRRGPLSILYTTTGFSRKSALYNPFFHKHLAINRSVSHEPGDGACATRP